jgi:hypothetical protein
MHGVPNWVVTAVGRGASFHPRRFLANRELYSWDPARSDVP